MKHVVEVVAYGDDEIAKRIVKRIECDGERRAQMVEDGVNRNLDHARFYTRMVIVQDGGA